MRRPARGLPTILVLLAIPGGARADDAPARVAGTWKKTQVFEDGATISWIFKFKQDGEKVTGTYVAGSHQHEIKDGKIEGVEISFWIEGEVNGKTYRVDYLGTVDKGSIRGTQESQMNGGPKRTLPWQTERISDEGPK